MLFLKIYKYSDFFRLISIKITILEKNYCRWYVLILYNMDVMIIFALKQWCHNG